MIISRSKQLIPKLEHALKTEMYAGTCICYYTYYIN